MIVRFLDHPWFDELVVPEHLVLDPDACKGHGFRNTNRLPILTMQPLTDNVLHVGVAKRFRLTDEEGQLSWKLISALDQPGNRLR